ncbi:unnamed protein product [Vitrella brassicaformis CCMP3155]|uniref:Uncharacterized protein n=1 Tax=Vitrella brassicaformis (strain CCMP3155) TaxID=1169540 RepID=A0A0G4EBK3_VITBC|nr:unnamed protein product [Vitrella brassicaformis CCMP3155]|eukprot:CEL93356.1 unnamed protein product [Vitrella brassicaformis CCMP3155]
MWRNSSTFKTLMLPTTNTSSLGSTARGERETGSAAAAIETSRLEHLRDSASADLTAIDDGPTKAPFVRIFGARIDPERPAMLVEGDIETPMEQVPPGANATAEDDQRMVEAICAKAALDHIDTFRHTTDPHTGLPRLPSRPTDAAPSLLDRMDREPHLTWLNGVAAWLANLALHACQPELTGRHITLEQIEKSLYELHESFMKESFVVQASVWEAPATADKVIDLAITMSNKQVWVCASGASLTWREARRAPLGSRGGLGGRASAAPTPPSLFQQTEKRMERLPHRLVTVDELLMQMEQRISMPTGWPTKSSGVADANHPIEDAGGVSGHGATNGLVVEGMGMVGEPLVKDVRREDTSPAEEGADTANDTAGREEAGEREVERQVDEEELPDATPDTTQQQPPVEIAPPESEREGVEVQELEADQHLPQVFKSDPAPTSPPQEVRTPVVAEPASLSRTPSIPPHIAAPAAAPPPPTNYTPPYPYATGPHPLAAAAPNRHSLPKAPMCQQDGLEGGWYFNPQQRRWDLWEWDDSVDMWGVKSSTQDWWMRAASATWQWRPDNEELRQKTVSAMSALWEGVVGLFSCECQ